MAYYPKVDQKICEILGGSLALNLKLLHALSRRDVKHFKYTHNYPTPTQQPAITTILIILIIITIINNNNKNKMARKINKRNRRRVAYYYINKYDYEAREKLTEDQPPSKETYSDEKAKVVKLRPEYTWNEFWAPTITVQTTSRKA